MNIVKQSKARLDNLNKLGIFLAFFLIAATAAFFYSPVIKSHASSDSTTIGVKLDVGSVIAIRTNTDELNLNANAGNFVHGAVNVDVSTNSQYGYTLNLEDVDSDTNMTSLTAGVTDTVSSNFSGSKTSSTMADNTWGYSLDSTNFYKIPASGSAARLANTSSASPSNPGYNRTAVDFGIKVGPYLTSGTYADVVKFTAYVNGQDGEPILPMQGFSCSTLANVGDSVTLTDTRDGNTYTVKKLADGNCWMTENLRIAGKTLTADDSDLPSGTTWTVPASSLSGFDDFNQNDVYVDSTYGGYYSFYAATAGWGTTSVTSGSSPRSICPKGWRLPVTYEFRTLDTNYNSASAMMGEPGFVLSGYVYNGSFEDQGDGGYYWSSSVADIYDAYLLELGSDHVSSFIISNKPDGFPVRCIAGPHRQDDSDPIVDDDDDDDK